MLRRSLSHHGLDGRGYLGDRDPASDPDSYRVAGYLP